MKGLFTRNRTWCCRLSRWPSVVVLGEPQTPYSVGYSSAEIMPRQWERATGTITAGMLSIRRNLIVVIARYLCLLFYTPCHGLQRSWQHWLVLGTDPVHNAAATICLSRPLIVCACIDDKDFIIEVIWTVMFHAEFSIPFSAISDVVGVYNGSSTTEWYTKVLNSHACLLGRD